ncbi:hypothetical protein QP519_10955 [Weeksella virosa]|uniref:hypothetical protein n=1 Tax=Weeksella virosa TaxID=1014 RepID=UPI002555B206|nr:hypothetical protein [Weeksella virosa]MDK7376050.1 hypothetical protein [Weeksella virosa]
MKLTDYKEREIPGWHEPNVTEELIIHHKGKLVGAFFPETTANIKYLIDFIIEGCRENRKSFIPHVYGNRQLESIFFGGLRTDGSLGRHKATIAAFHKEKENNDILKAIALLGELGVEFASSRSVEIRESFENQRRQQNLLCDKSVCITNHFTSGSINYNGLLGLHYDTASLPGVLNLIFYKRKGKGGNLVIPQLDTCIDSKSYSLALLNVREMMHGVTAFEGDYRDSIVFYSVNGMG